MPLLTFVPVPDPSVGTGSTITPRVLKAQFGDGYNQRTGDGINTTPETWAVRWGLLSVAQMTVIWDFLKPKSGTGEAFIWTPPGLTAARYICNTLDRSTVDGFLWSIGAEFVQVYDHG